MVKRIQRKRIKGWRLPKNTVCVNRPTRWGNSFKVTDDGKPFNPFSRKATVEIYDLMTIEQSLENFESYLLEKLKENPNFLEPLRGKDLACFCKEGEPCHGDILIKYANEVK